MKKYKNIILSLVSYLLAFLWLLLWSQFIYGNTSNPADAFQLMYLSPYFILITIATFFSWKSLKLKESSIVGNIVTLIAVVVLFTSILYYSWLISWF